MKPRWDWYACQLHGRDANVYVDLAYAAAAPLQGFGSLCWVLVPLARPLANGLASPEETPRLAELENALVPAITKELPAAYVARATTHGRRELYFYARDADRLGAIVRAVPTEYRCEVGARPDPGWSHFLGVLMPGPHELQLMHTRDQLKELQRRGDGGGPRPVRHFAWFADWQSRARFRAWAEGQGFACADHVPSAAGPVPGRPFGCVLERVDAASEAALPPLVAVLFEQAAGLGGEYDGWESAVVTEP
jgi:hypothetical protein